MRSLVFSLFLGLLSYKGYAQVKLSHNEMAGPGKISTPLGQFLAPQGGKTSNIDLNSRVVRNSSSNSIQEYLIKNGIKKENLFGGGDAGGGNLLLGRPLESYVLDINKSAEMQMALKLLSTIGKVGFDRMDSEIQYVINNKSWYLVPVDLPRLASQSIGITFAADQGALQDFEEVWIDQKSYEKMNFDGRVQLLVHEIFMGLKIFSFESYYRQCEVNKPFGVECLNLREHQDRKMLNIRPDDYKDVRQAVNIIFKNYNYLSSADYAGSQSESIAAKLFSGGGFDSYFVKPSTQGNATKEFDDRDVVNALRNQVTKGGLPGYCNHKIIEDLGNHTYKMRAQLQSKITFEEKNGEIQFKVMTRDLNTGKTILNNSYFVNSKDKIMNVTYGNNKSSLTLSFSMGVPAYTMQYMSGVKSLSGKNVTAGAVAVGLISDESVNSLAFASFNIRNGAISFYDGKDILKCFEKIEYICEGPECLH